jgi:hypothetical protein
MLTKKVSPSYERSRLTVSPFLYRRGKARHSAGEIKSNERAKGVQRYRAGTGLAG